jgi:hypothetical protein
MQMREQAAEAAIELRIPLVPLVTSGNGVELVSEFALLEESGEAPGLRGAGLLVRHR